MKKFFLTCLFILLASPAWATTYFLAPASAGGNDSNNGTSASTPWLSPNHSVNCGDVIIAAASTSYSAADFGSGEWGTVSCPAGNNVAWLKCATFDACKITATSSDGMWINKSYWGVQGWEISTNTTTVGACFHAGPTTSSTIIHHIIFANDIANGCRGGGFTAYDLNASASVDYIVYVGNIAYNAASGSGACYSGLNVYQPIASDTVTGTHIYVAGNFAYNNVDGNPCAGGAPTDGEGINLDTFDFSQGGGPVYTQQAVAQNNISVSNGGRGIYAENNKAGGGSNATIIFKFNTMYGNDKDPNQGFCVGNGDLGFQAVFNSTATNNIAETDTANGCSGVAKWALEMANDNNTVFMNTNWLYLAAGNTIFTSNNGSGSPGSNHTGASAAFTSTTIPGAPSCGSATSVTNCMATMISNFKPTASSASAYGYQIPLTTSVNDPLFPQWLCNVNLPTGLVTMGCGASSSSLPAPVTITNVTVR
jgi:hypothetical protein